MTAEAIAITGISTLFAGSPDWCALWQNIVSGRDLISDVPASHWLAEDYFDSNPQAPDKIYCQRGSFLDPVGFDALNFGIPPSNVPCTDTSQLLALILAERLFRDIAADSLSKIDRERISVILGVTGATELTAHMSGRMARPQWEQGLRDSGFQPDEVARIADRIAAQFVGWQESTFPGLLGNVVAGRIANRFDLGGTNCIVDAACASSLGALSMAVNELRLGQSDMVITGGVDTLNDPLMYLCFSKTPALSATGDCRPFSDQADGTLLGEGLALVALRRLTDAERDGDRVYAVIKGLGTSSDGRSKSVYAPRSVGQARALRRAYQAAGYDPSTVELVEAHGTATKAGDVAEFDALKTVFGESSTNGTPWCALGSIKSQVGHTKAAAGVAGLAKAVLALHHKVLPPTIKVQQPNPVFEIDASPFYLNIEAGPWIRGSDHPRRASVSSFGFGGSNFHVTLEEYGGKAPRPNDSIATPSELILISGSNESDLSHRLSELMTTCDSAGATADALRTLAQQSWKAFVPSHSHRGAIVAENVTNLRSRLKKLSSHLQTQGGTRLWLAEGIYFDTNATTGQVAWLFPGQGSQYVGMQRELAMAFHSVRDVWDRAASMPCFGNAPLHKAVFPPTAFSQEAKARQVTELRRMEVAQPAIAACSLATSRLMASFGIRRDFVAGHSFGELSALCAAGTISETDLISLSRVRGVAMSQSSGSDSGMTAVAVAESDVLPLLKPFGQRLVIANHNGPRQVVVSGDTSALTELEAELSGRQWSFRRLDVAAACHSPRMQMAVDTFAAALAEVSFKSPDCRVGWNATGNEWRGPAEALKTGLSRQLVQPVRFVEMIESLYAAGVRTFIEVGPSAVLTGLVNDILFDRQVLAVATDRKGQPGIHCLWQALAQLAVQGAAIDWSVAERVFTLPQDDSRHSEARHAIPISGANVGKPYPANRSLAVATDVWPKVSSMDSRAEIADVASNQPVTRIPQEEPVIVNHEPQPHPISPAIDGSVEHVEQGWNDTADADPWLMAFREVQQQTALAHQVYLQAMSETHRAFLQASSGVALPADSFKIPTMPDPRRVATPAYEAALPMSCAPSPAARSVSVAPALQASATTGPVIEDADLTPPAMSVVVERQVTANDAPAVEAIVLEIVADKTGYSVEVLDPTLQIEAGLGIDSIKRVEILSALADRLPQLTGMDLSDFATYQTLGDVIEAVRARVPSSGEVHSARQPSMLDRTHVQTILLEVVAEKTGYPQDLIELGMDIESGLGIDSIKRVEILSTLIDRFPELGSVDASEFNTQRTLGDLLEKAMFHLAGSPVLETTTSAPSRGDVKAPEPVVARDREPAESHLSLKIREVTLTESLPTGFALPGMTAKASMAIIAGLNADDYTRQTAAELGRALRSHGIQSQLADSIEPGVTGVIHLGGLTPCVDAQTAAKRHWDACSVAQTLRRILPAQPLVFVTVQDTGGRFGRDRIAAGQALTAGFAGLAKTALAEWPEASIKAIDLDRRGRTPADAARAIVDELLFGGTELEVALPQDGPRASLSCRDWTSVDTRTPWAGLSPRPTIVVSGGGRGVTAACLIALARRIQPRFVLLGRTLLSDDASRIDADATEASLKRQLVADAQSRGATVDLARIQTHVDRLLSQREVHQTITALRAAGSEVQYVAVDVRDETQLGIAFESIRRSWGPIRGIIHGAGVLADRKIADKQASQFDDVFQTKVSGLETLLNASRLDPLETIVLFSSIAARLGNAGQVDYSAANEVLNKVAHHEAGNRGESCRVLSINWGAWNGGMVDDSLRGHFERQGVSLIPLQSGAELFADLVLSSNRPPVEVVVTAEVHKDVRLQSPVPACRDRAAMAVSVDRFPFIDSHQLKNQAVIPLVLVVEWFCRALRQRYPHLTLTSLHDLKVLRGVSLSDPKAVKLLDVVFSDPHQNGALELRVELRGPDDVIHYRCRAELAYAPSHVASVPRLFHVAESGDWPWTLDQAYDRLFHGPAFRVLRTLDAFHDSGARATLVGTRSMDWQGGPWLTDPAALDGGIQVALLWSMHRTGRMSLPSAITTIRFHHPAVESNLLHCEVAATSVGTHQDRFDIHLRSPQGTPIVDLLSVDMTLMQSAATH